MSELNPEHPTTISLHDQWHKIAAIILFKTGKLEETITSEDIDALNASGYANIAMQEVNKVLHIRLVSDAKAVELARAHGGVPDPLTRKRGW